MKILEEPSGFYSNTSEDFFKPPLKGLARTLKTNQHDSCVVEPCICASRGRNPENPSDRTVGAETEQRFEINENGTSNTLTSVQKDNYLIEPSIIQNPHGFNKGNEFEISPTLTTSAFENNNFVKDAYRVRKLTPLECIRLMDFDDNDYDKIKAVGMSDSQIYKQCGNSIVVACLEGVFHKMYINTEVSNEQLSLF